MAPKQYSEGGENMISRRGLLGTIAGGALASAVSAKEAAAQRRVERAANGMPSPKIKDVQVIAVQPGNVRLIVVKILTDQDGLYGYGCATFTQRAEVVVTAVQQYLKPFLVGRPADRIEDLWQAMYNSSYWRNGPVLNNAISGVDQALWDIKGRQAGMPVYQLLGGKCREAVDLYTGVNGRDAAQISDGIRKAQAAGYRYFRFNIGGEGGAADPARGPNVLHSAPLFDRDAYIHGIVKAFEGIRKELGGEVPLMNDVHEKITPTQALKLCKEVEQYNPFFLEDPLSPEDLSYYRIIRQQCATPIAMGELLNSPHEWTPLITERLIDYIRVHVSHSGGLTPARKIAVLGEMHGVRTAWHGPADVSPVGHCANVTLSIAAYNFGIQEISAFSDATREIFKGCPEVKNGYGYVNEAPGWGLEVDEKAVARYPFRHDDSERGKLNYGWSDLRLPDG
jgi:mannonate dehydratase